MKRFNVLVFVVLYKIYYICNFKRAINMETMNDNSKSHEKKNSNRVIDPIFDAGFKLIFGREKVSERLLINILNNIFSGDPMFGNITSLKFTNSERPNEYIEGKGIRYDIKCETAAGHH